MSEIVKTAADSLMEGVAQLLHIPEGQIAKAAEIMREKMKAFVSGDEYQDARECLALKSLHPGYIMGLLVLDCVIEIKKLPGVTGKGAVS